jgi:hypothetical protein
LQEINKLMKDLIDLVNFTFCLMTDDNLFIKLIFLKKRTLVLKIKENSLAQISITRKMGNPQETKIKISKVFNIINIITKNKKNYS